LKPAVHNPFISSGIGGVTTAPRFSVDQSNRLAMFCPETNSAALNGEGTVDVGESCDILNPTASPPVVRKIALKTLAAPPEEPASKHRKLNSQARIEQPL
jgi:hypothetical protein